MSQSRLLKVLLAILALVICTGTMQAAAVIQSSVSNLALTCDTVTGAPALTVPVTLVSGAVALMTKVTATAGLAATINGSGIWTAGGPVVINPTYVSTGLNVTSAVAASATSFTFSIAPGCMGVMPSTTPILTYLIFTPATGTGFNVTVTMTVTTGGGSALAPSPSTLSFTCNTTTHTVTAAQPVAVTSAATGGTSFTIGPLTGVSSWLAVSAGGLANASPVTLTVTVTGGVGAGCSLLTAGLHTFAIPLLSGPTLTQVTKSINVYLYVGPTSPITPGSTSVALGFTQGGTPGAAPIVVGLTSVPTNVYVAVDATTVPGWLSVTSSTTNTPLNLTFESALGVKALNRGFYTANVHLQVAGYLDYVMPVTIQVNAVAATLSLLQNTVPALVYVSPGVYTESLSWTVGSATYPSFTLTPISSDTPIPFTVTTTPGSLFPITSTIQGLAYNFGNPFTVTFPISAFATLGPAVSSQLASVTITAGSTTITINIDLAIAPPNALITGMSPTVVPTSAPSIVPIPVVITGTGFITGAGGTVVGIVPSPGFLAVDPNVTWTVLNSTSILVSIIVPATNDSYLPFYLATSSSVTVGVCNPAVGATVCSIPYSGPLGSGTAALTIGVNPIISAVTSASSYVEATAPLLPNIAPYDILTIFGTNFCVSASTGCVAGSANALLYAATNATTFAYPTTLSPDASGASQRLLTVGFYQHGTATLIAVAPLLFATNNQINLLAPSALAAKEGSTVDVVVSFGYGVAPAATLLKSQPFTVNVAATDPGIFTVGGDGEGDSATLANSTYTLIATASPATIRTIGANSDIVDLYVTGLGVPDSTYTTVLDGTGLSDNCMPAAAYWALDTGTTSDDGLVIEPSFFSANAIQPCLRTNGANIPAVSIGGQPATVLFAGWVQGAVAGLYQIDVQLPSAVPSMPSLLPAFTYAAGNIPGNAVGNPAATGSSDLSVVVTANGKTSQSGVGIWVEQSLLATVSSTTAGMVSTPSFVASNPVYTVTAPPGVALPAAGVLAVTVAGSQGSAGADSVYTYAVASPGTVNGLTTSAFADGITVDGTVGTIIGTPTAASNGLSVEITVTETASGWIGNVILTFVIT